MANVNNANEIMFINSKNGKVAMSKVSMTVQKEGDVPKVQRSFAKYSDSAEVGALDMFVQTMVDMQKNFPQSLLVFMQDNGAKRVIEARKHYNEFKMTMEGDGLVEAVVTATVKEWMGDAQKQSIAQMASLMVQVWNAGLDVSVACEHTSHSWELNVPQGVEIKAGDKLTFKKGIDVETGIKSWDTTYIEGEYTVRTNTYTDQNGVERTRYYVPRQGNKNALAVINGVKDDKGNVVSKGLRQLTNELLPHRLDITKVQLAVA